jgi:hypothetical protein
VELGSRRVSRAGDLFRDRTLNHATVAGDHQPVGTTAEQLRARRSVRLGRCV